MADSELRQRKLAKVEDDPKTTRLEVEDEEEEPVTYWVDILRVLTFLMVASCGLSYLITNGDSWVWGGVNRPQYTTVDWWKAQLQGPMYMTPDELSAYDGRDPEKPIYLAINSTIYDVSKGRHIYGPGGSYNWFAGTDASRGFVTGCFADDRTPDMRGVEQMYLPLDDPEVDAHWTTAEMEKLKAEEMENAKKRVHSALEHWVKFFGKSKKYTFVGYVKREDGWLEKLAPSELCAPAQKGRSKRRIPKD